MLFQQSALDAIAFGALAVCIVASLLYRQRRLSLPPGPRGLPLIGNLLDMPPSHEWLTFAEWKKTWGDLIYLNLPGQPIVVINSAAHALALLDRRSTIYSDRPHSAVGEFIGYTTQLVLRPADARFREMRRMFAKLVGSAQAMANFIPLVEAEEGKMVVALWRDPAHGSIGPEKHIRQAIGAISLEVTYGYKTKGGNDDFVRLSEVALTDFAHATAPGAFAADMFPILLHVPSWLPGAGWKRKIIRWRESYERFRGAPFEWTKQQIAAGTSNHNFVATSLADSPSQERQETVRHAAAAFYGGASDTTVSAMGSFFLTMMLYPDIQSKAQAEIDAVVGRERLPAYADRARLPYVEAIFKELLRWNPVPPLGIPHRLREDDAYEGFAFRAGTLFLPNVWLFLHDPETYADPLAFNPARFLKSDGHEPEQDPSKYAFGFGRRVCPGQLLGEASLYMGCVLSLAALRIAPVEGATPMRPEDIQYTTGTISHPPPFACSVVPRDAEAEGLLEALEAALQEA